MPNQPIHILFIGNSFTGRNDLPGMIARLAACGSPPVIVESRSLLANGMSLRFHFNKGEARALIAEGRWDFVVLQEQSTLPFKSPAKMHEAIELFDPAIKSTGARTVLYLTWARLATPEKQSEITEAYSRVGKKLGDIVVPVGVAWERCLQADPALELHDKDGSHPSPAGTNLAACVFVRTLFGASVLGLPADRSGLGPQDLAVVQRIAEETGAEWTQ